MVPGWQRLPPGSGRHSSARWCLTGMANSGRVATTEVGPDRGEAGAGERPGEMHRHVASDNDRCPAARPAQALSRTPNRLATRWAMASIVTIASARRASSARIVSDRLRIKGSRSCMRVGWRALLSAPLSPTHSPALVLMLEPHFQCQSGDPAVESTVAIAGLGQCFDSLGLERYTLLAGTLENIPAARCQSRWRDPRCQSPHEAVDQSAWPYTALAMSRARYAPRTPRRHRCASSASRVCTSSSRAKGPRSSPSISSSTNRLNGPKTTP